MKKLFAFAGCISCLMLFLFPLHGCYKKSNNLGVTVAVTSISPTHGGSGTLVTITGTGFFSDTSQESVSMSFVKAPIIAATPTQIVVAVPLIKDSATLDSVFILVDVQGAVRNAGYFTFDNANVGANNVTTFAGSGIAGSANGTGTSASFNAPENGVFDRLGNLYVADYGNNEIRKVSPAGVVTTFAGSTTAGYKDGPAGQALFNAPSGLCFDNNGNLYVSDELNNRIRKIDQSGNVTTIAGTGVAGYLYGSHSSSTALDRPIGIAYDSISNILVVADSRNNVIRGIHLSDSTIFTLAGPIDGPTNSGSTDETTGNSLNCSFNSPRGIALYSMGSVNVENLFVYVADYGNNKIREIYSVGNINQNGINNINTTTYTIGGNANNQPGLVNNYGGSGSAAFSGPNSLALGYYSLYGPTEIFFVADAGNHVIRACPTAQLNSLGNGFLYNTLAGSGSPGLLNGNYFQAQFKYPDGIAYNPVDGNLYVIEFGNNDIRKILLH